MTVCECPVAGFCTRRNIKMTSLHWKKCQAGHVESLDDLYQNQRRPDDTPVVRSAAPKHARIGDELSKIIERETGETPCRACGDEIARLNGMGVEQVRTEKTSLAEKLVVRAQTKKHAWYDILGKARAWAAAVAPQMVAAEIEKWIEEACIATEVKLQELKRITEVETTSRRSRSVKSSAPNRPEFHEFPPADLSGSRRHLMFHLWPLREIEAWQWHIRQLALRWPLFNGVKILSCSIDHMTVHESEVIAYSKTFGMEWDHVIAKRNNATIGEVDSWSDKISLLPEPQPNDVVFYAHGKGVRVRTNTTAVRMWTQLMYEANLDFWPVTQRILESHLFCGALRRMDHYRLPGNFRWHYSGTFYWFRWEPISQRHPKVIPRKYIGTEAWPGAKARIHEGGVIFLDAMRHSLYDEPTMTQVVWPMWDAWKKQNHHNRTEENMCSPWCVNFARMLPHWSVPGKSVLEIGSLDVNGSCRQLIMQQCPASYLGTDMREGPGVDLVCLAEKLPDSLGIESADVIICTEVLEHVLDWYFFIRQIWSLLRLNGVLLLTTRSPGFHRHDYPSDYWRFTTDILRQVFDAQEILTLTIDPTPDPGVGIIVQKMGDSLHSATAIPAPES